MHIIVIIYEISNVKIALNIISIGFVVYFYDTNFFQILYLIHHKMSGGLDGFIFLIVKVFSTLLYVYVKNCNLDFGQTNFLFNLSCYCPFALWTNKSGSQKTIWDQFSSKNNFTSYFSIVLKLSSLFLFNSIFWWN